MVSEPPDHGERHGPLAKMSESVGPQVWEAPWDKARSSVYGPIKRVSQRLQDRVSMAIEWKIDLPFEYGVSTAIHIAIEQKLRR